MSAIIEFRLQEREKSANRKVCIFQLPVKYVTGVSEVKALEALSLFRREFT